MAKSTSVVTKHKDAYLILEAVANKQNMPTPELSKISGIEYRNLNKRAKRLATRLEGFVERRRVGRCDHWHLTERWQGVRRTDILAAFREQPKRRRK